MAAATAPTPTKYPMSDAKLKETLIATEQQGSSYHTAVELLSGAGYTDQLVQSQLKSMGYSVSQIAKIVNSRGGGIRALLYSAGSSAVPIPGVTGAAAAAVGSTEAAGATAVNEATGAAAGAEAGAGTGAAEGGAAGGAASKAASAVAGNAGKIAAGLTVAGLFTNIGTWKGVSLCICGAVLVVLALRQFQVV